jgi:hypothetical protein
MPQEFLLPGKRNERFDAAALAALRQSGLIRLRFWNASGLP